MAEKFPVDPVVEAYNRFKHIDRLLVEVCLDSDDPYYRVCLSLWTTVKQHCKRVGYAGLVENRKV